jgi:3',5'-cyclic AMP phosphodiesterase CpdA
MKILQHSVFCLVFFFLGFSSFSQDVSFIALGDIHYDRLDDHDWDYVMTRPQDFRQIMEEYPQYTAVYLPGFLRLIKSQSELIHPAVNAVVQLGDLVEGVAGTNALSRQMDRGAVDLLYAIDLAVPWVLVKGNHDVSNSPGQPDAWQEVILNYFKGFSKQPFQSITLMNPDTMH